jgi:hypothetical protein
MAYYVYAIILDSTYTLTYELPVYSNVLYSLFCSNCKQIVAHTAYSTRKPSARALKCVVP